ncbi:MAG: hypothetical protein LUH47_10935 [Clostridiales bacterium]|nr:hypothetical protein [Clostridiales bacterium]
MIIKIKKKSCFKCCVITALIPVIIIVGIIIYYLPAIMIGGGLSFRYSSKNKILREFNKNYDRLSEVSDYLLSVEYNTVWISSTDYIYDTEDYGTWYISDAYGENAESGRVKINDDDFVNTLNYLFSNRKYNVINRDESTISFQLWANLDCGKGIAYSADGSSLNIDYLTYSEPLSEENWYYYEADFNLYRERRENGEPQWGEK